MLSPLIAGLAVGLPLSLTAELWAALAGGLGAAVVAGYFAPAGRDYPLWSWPVRFSLARPTPLGEALLALLTLDLAVSIVLDSSFGFGLAVGASVFLATLAAAARLSRLLAIPASESSAPTPRRQLAEDLAGRFAVAGCIYVAAVMAFIAAHTATSMSSIGWQLYNRLHVDEQLPRSIGAGVRAATALVPPYLCGWLTTAPGVRAVFASASRWIVHRWPFAFERSPRPRSKRLHRYLTAGPRRTVFVLLLTLVTLGPLITAYWDYATDARSPCTSPAGHRARALLAEKGADRRYSADPPVRLPHNLTIEMRYADGAPCAWALLGNAATGDEVWLERRGPGTPVVTVLGRRKVRPDRQTTYTGAYDWFNHSIRGCARVESDPRAACTPWTTW